MASAMAWIVECEACGRRLGLFLSLGPRDRAMALARTHFELTAHYAQVVREDLAPRLVAS